MKKKLMTRKLTKSKFNQIVICFRFLILLFYSDAGEQSVGKPREEVMFDEASGRTRRKAVFNDNLEDELGDDDDDEDDEDDVGEDDDKDLDDEKDEDEEDEEEEDYEDIKLKPTNSKVNDHF